jgi:homoprotocatechuate degradation regulator HpaR
MRPFSESLPMALLRTREAVMRLFRPGLRSRGVTEQQWRILRALAHQGPMEVTELAEATFLLAPSLSRILPDLEQRRLIGRRPVDTDLRRSVVSLQTEGLRLIAEHAPYSEQVYARIAKRFGTEKLVQLLQRLHDLETSLGELAGELESDPARVRRRKPSP